VALLNPTFQEAGPTPGSAKSWRIVASVRAERLVAFGPSPERAREDFERWGTLLEAFPAGSLVLAFFDKKPQGRETFEGWTGGVFLDELGPALLKAALFAGKPVDTMDWGGPLHTTWDEVSATAAPLGADDVEAFESWTLPTTPAFAATAFGTETFEATWALMTTL